MSHMQSFKDFLSEGNQLQQKINKQLSRGNSVGTISPEGPHTNTAEKKSAAHSKIKSDLESARKSGHIGGWSGPHSGQYQYGSGSHEVAKEGSYITHSSGSTPEHHDKLLHTLKKLGNAHNQESVLNIKSSGEGSYHHLDRSERKGKVDNIGKTHYNVPLGIEGGNTKLKGSKTRDMKSNKDTRSPKLSKGNNSFTMK